MLNQFTLIQFKNKLFKNNVFFNDLTMESDILRKINWKLITGLIIIVCNLFWIWIHLNLFYLYNYAEILIFMPYPNWILILNSIIGIVGVCLGLSVIRKKIKIKLGILINIIIILTGALFELFILIL